MTESHAWAQAWEHATRVSQQAAETGFDWPNLKGVVDKLLEESLELQEALDTPNDFREELGDVVFTLVNIFRKAKLSPNIVLEEATHKFCTRFDRMQHSIKDKNRDLSNLSLQEMDDAWNAIKTQNKGPLK